MVKEKRMEKLKSELERLGILAQSVFLENLFLLQATNSLAYGGL